MDDKCWLVKSSFCILGPYTKEEVYQLLRNKTITALDEVRLPRERWRAVRENKEFIEEIKKLKKENVFVGEATQTLSMAKTPSSQTNTEPILVRDNFTPTPQMYSKTPTPETFPVREVASITPPSAASSEGAGLVQKFGSATDGRIQSQIRERSRWLRLVLISFGVLVLAGYFAFDYLKSARTERSFEDQLKISLRLKEQHLYDRSIEVFRKALAHGKPTTRVMFEMGPIMMGSTHETEEWRNLFGEVLANPASDPNIVARATHARALSYMYDQDFKAASGELDRFLGMDLNNFEAQLNQAMLFYYSRKFQEAYDAFAGLMSRRMSSVEALYGKALSMVAISRESRAKSRAKDMASQIEIYRGHYLRRELKLIQAYLYYLESLIPQMDRAVSEFVNEPISASRDFVHPEMVFWDFFGFENLSQICGELTSFRFAEPTYMALRVQCDFMLGKQQAAEKNLRDFRLQNNKHQALQLTQAQLLLERSQLIEATAVLVGMKGGLANLLRMEVCYRKRDQNCVSQIIGGQNEPNPEDPYGVFYYVWGFNAPSNRQKIYDMTEKALEAHPNFRRLLEIRFLLESQE